MKKTITLILSAILAGILFPSHAITVQIQDGTIEKINVETEGDAGNDRSGAHLVEAYLFHATNTLHVALAYSVGAATITVVDSFGATVYTGVVDATVVGSTQFAAPTVTGTYTLEVQSATYYGRGIFNI